jgi:hypothetical protein
VDSSALAAGLAVARRIGLSTADPTVLAEGTNLVVHLRPARVVARVTRIAHLIRPVHQLRAAVALARMMNGLVVAPITTAEPGPFIEDGRYVTFWTLTQRGSASPKEAGSSLRAFHEAARTRGGELRSFDPRLEAVRIADLVGGDAGEVLKAAAKSLAAPNLPQQPIHGDAHLANVVAGGVWQDMDEACVGPIEWDVACLRHRWSFFDEIENETRDALAAYGPYDEDALEALEPLVVLFTAAWGSLAPTIGEAIGPRTRQRLDWLRSRS